jgi:photosystem II stability/assembly factor-like uncharacterized protein
MKKLFTALFVVFSFCSISYSQWNVVYTPNPAQTVMCLKFWDNNTGYHAGILYNSSTFNIHKTTNGGLNYTDQSSNFTAQRFMSVWIIHPDTVFMSGNYGKIIRTVNGGTNWSTMYSDTNLQFWGLWFTSSQTGYVAGSNGVIMKTTNTGTNWFSLTTPTSTALDGIWFVNDNTGYVGGANVFLKTTDAGATWVNKTGLFISPFETAQSVYFSDDNTGYYCTNTANCRIVKTTNGGDNWSLVNDNATAGAGWDMSFPNTNTGYVCTGNGYILKTTNAGLNWGVQNTPLTENLYQIHFPSVNTGYVACWSGKILKTTNGGLTFTANVNGEIPEKYELEQNFPNPFNPQTTIRFSVPKKEFITLKVFDIKGQEVKSLIADEYQPGNYEIKLTGEGLSSGVYYYRMQSKDYSQTKKMILLK